MSILQRFKAIMSSNLHDLLDKTKNNEKTIDQYLRTIQLDLGKVKSEKVAMIAEEQRAKRALDECKAEMNKMEKYAMKSIESGNEENARKFLEKKAVLGANASTLEVKYNEATINLDQMRQMHDKLIADLRELEARGNMIKAKVSMTKIQEKMNEINGPSIGNYSISNLGKMEEAVDRAFEEANAKTELNKDPLDNIKDLSAKYDECTVDDELAALKAQIKKNE
jgi:phage shock protein A